MGMESDTIAISTVVADILISMAYLAIPVEIWFFQRSLTKPLPFKFILVFFELFISACGLTHLVGVWVPWTRTDPVLLAVKMLCAAISVATAIVMVTVLPKVFSFPARAALMEEELGVRIRHERSLQKANDLLIKFRKITNSLRRTLDVSTICDTAVMELCLNLPFTGMALFLLQDDGGGYVCQAEFINNVASKPAQHKLATHYWKTITIDPTTSVFRRLSSVSCTCYLSAMDLFVLANKQRGMLYRNGIALSLQTNGSNRGFMIGFNEHEVPTLSEEDSELFEDVVSQVEIAITQARQIQNENMHMAALQHHLLDNANLDREKHSAEVASRLKSQVIATTAQEIVTPIAEIQGIASHLLKTSTDQQRDAIESMLLHSKALDLIKSNLSDFVKVDNNCLTLQKVPLDIKRCLEETFAQLGNLTTPNKIQFVMEEGVPSSVIGDFTHLQLIIKTILANVAAPASPSSQTKVTVSLSSDPPPELSFLTDPSCLKFAHNNLAPRQKLPHRTQIYFHIYTIQPPRINSPSSHHNTNLATGSPLRPGLGFMVIAHLIQRLDGDLIMRSCAHRGTIYSFNFNAQISSPEPIG
ncbi:mitochondrial 2-enoyl thioester reductase [Massospora cicadina]|nr:mitochondrial 2-enoyl thioester reductase [Massospora cicadina]